MGTISIRTKILLALALPLLTAVVLLGWGANRYLDTPDSDVRSFLLMGSALMIGVSAVAALLAWRVIRPLENLAADARAVVDVRLPALLERMRSTENSEELRLARLEVKSNDEVGQLAEAFNQVQEATVGVAVDQAALLRRGIGDLFVALAKRNQGLIERQLAFIDELEANEEDPDQLEALFHLDHLATRAQRNAESLLVLAGQAPRQLTGEAIEIDDVVRVAQGEVEGFSRIELGPMVAASLDRAIAGDLAHLLAELLENATMYSPEDTAVTVSSETDGKAVAISVVDTGPGLSPERLRAANELLANPPLLGLTGASDLGLNLVSRLAARHQVHVELRSAPSAGLQAILAIPSSLLLGAPQATEDGPEAPRDLLFETPGEVVEDTEAVDGEPADFEQLSDPNQALDALSVSTDATLDDEPIAPEPAAEFEQLSDPDSTDAPLNDEPIAPEPVADALPTRNPQPETDVAAPEPVAEFEQLSDPDSTDAPLNDEPIAPEPVADALPTRNPQPETDVAAPEPVAEPTSTMQSGGLESGIFADPDPFAPVHTPVASEVPDTSFGTLGTPVHNDEPSANERLMAAMADEVADVESAGDDADEPAVTSAGLVRRTPSTTAPEGRAPAGDRSPEALREMLSRYRSRLDEGRAGSGTDEENQA